MNNYAFKNNLQRKIAIAAKRDYVFLIKLI